MPQKPEIEISELRTSTATPSSAQLVSLVSDLLKIKREMLALVEEVKALKEGKGKKK